jgi:uncharacterized protein (DUF2336 family)
MPALSGQARAVAVRQRYRIQILGLQAERGDGGPQFMRRVSNEAALLVDHEPYPVEQAVDRCDERMQLAQVVLDRKLVQIVGLPCIEPGR